jgi:hypothetical protein
MRSHPRIIGASMLAMAVLLLFSLPVSAQSQATTINRAVAFGVTAPLSQLAKLPQAPVYGFHEANPVRRIPKPNTGSLLDRVSQSFKPVSPATYAVNANFLGVGNGFPGYTVPDAPPDTTMAVGDTQIVQWVNVSMTICSKTSPYTCGSAILGNHIWQSGLPGSLCANNNDGDIIAQWDVAAHRWLLTQNVFVSPYAVCIAISTTPDATGTYYTYQFPVVASGFPDYPKWGIWPTGYFEAWNNFGPGGSGFRGPVLCAYNSAKLLAGDTTAEQICHQYSGSEDSLLPADRDSPIAPPTGQDEFAIGSVGDVDNAHLSLYSVHINNESDWSQGATFTGDSNSQLLAVSPYAGSCHGSFGGDCVPQKDSGSLLDSLGDRLMYRFAYWEDQPLVNVQATPPRPFPSQHWLVNFDVEAPGGQSGVRWMEITAPIKKVPVTALTIFQQGTYAPDSNWRWMGSVARDKVGDILVGYSESSATMDPSIFVAGRQVNDPLGLGNLEDEVQVVGGTGAQPSTANRWGDYSSMRIDQDGCTFWYTTEYYMVTQQFDWSTRVASIKFSNCN